MELGNWLKIHVNWRECPVERQINSNYLWSSVLYREAVYLFTRIGCTVVKLMHKEECLNVIQVACASRNMYVLCEGNKMFEAPYSYEPIEDGDKHYIYLEKIIPTPDTVIRIACGSAHLLLSTEMGLYGLGANNISQLGIDYVENGNYFDIPVLQLSCSYSISGIVVLFCNALQYVSFIWFM